MYVLNRDAQKENCEIIRLFQEKWGDQNENKCRPRELTLKALLAAYPKNNDYNEVLAKCDFINSMFSTRISTRNLETIALRISSYKGFDEKINNDDKLELISLIRDCADKHYRAFASKYCAVHNFSKYPIYDSLSVETLIKYQLKDNFYGQDFDKTFLEDYRNYIAVYDAFMEYYKVDRFNYREIDKYLWTVGKLELSI